MRKLSTYNRVVSLDGIRERLNRLDASAPAAERFDEGPPLQGRIAVLPASFNPPTLAHLQLLRAACAVRGVESAAAMLTTRNVDKGLFGAPLPDRVAMLLETHRAAEDIAVLACNQARLTDQADPVRDLFSGQDVDFIVGFDTLSRIFDDRYYRDMPSELDAFFARHRLIAANRGDITAADVHRYLETSVVARFARFVEVIEIPDDAADLSSTHARQAFAQARQPEGLLPEVAAYIHQRALYQD